MLNCNCASTMLLMMFFAKLLDKSQTPAKSTYLWNMFQRISAEATAQAYAAGQHGLRIDVHGTAGHHVLILQPNGMVLGVQDFLSSLHASVLESWRKVWGNMYSDALVSGPWQGELVFLDVLAFVLNAAKVRRSRKEKPELDCSATIANHFLPDFAWSYGPQHFGACRSKRNFRESSSFTTTVRPRKEVGCWVRLVSAFMSPGASFHLKSIGNCSIITIVK